MKHVKTFEGFFDSKLGSKYKASLSADYRGAQEIQDEREESQFQRKSEENKKIKLQDWISKVSPTFWKKFGSLTDQFGSPKYMNDMFQSLRVIVDDSKKAQFINNLSELQKLVYEILEKGSAVDGNMLKSAKKCNPSLDYYHQFFTNYNNLCSDKYKELKEKAPKSMVVNHYYGEELIDIREKVFDEVSQYLKKEMSKNLKSEALDSEVAVWDWRDIEEIKIMWDEFELTSSGYGA